ncbi:MAG: hypothetical protein ACRD40_19090 [Candidatus Acidiferrales bacterium]
MSVRNYTFGDTEEASLRLRRLAEIYEPESRALLKRSPIHAPHVAIDLGCGPGWSAALLRPISEPGATTNMRRKHSTRLKSQNWTDRLAKL